MNNIVSNDDMITDSVKMYFNEISEYHQLTSDEEIELANIIRYPERVKLLLVSDKNGINYYSLNINMLFNSLVNTNIYSSVIDSILELYSNIRNNNHPDEQVIIKYKKESLTLGRALNEKELKELFGIEPSNDILSQEEILNEVEEYKKYIYSYNRFFTANLKLVVSLANKFRSNANLLDLISEGNIGLLKAIQGFDPNMGCKFSTYAFYCIKQYINKAISSGYSIIKLPDNYQYEFAKYRKIVDNLEKEEQRKLSNAEIAEKLNIPIAKVNMFQNNMYETVSLDNNVFNDSDRLLIDTFSADDSGYDEMFSNELSDKINVVFEYLTESESKVIKLLFGIGSKNGRMSIREVANELSVSPSRVKIIEARALYKMHRIAKSNSKIKSLESYIK